MSDSEKPIFIEDLKILLGFSIITFVFILTPYFDGTIIKIIFVLIFASFIPGYAFVAAIFPKKCEIKIIERFILSIVFSSIILVFYGFAINSTAWSFSPISIYIALFLSTLIFAILTYRKRKHISEKERFAFSIYDFISPTKHDDSNIDLQSDEFFKEKKYIAVKKRLKILHITAKKSENDENIVPIEIEKVLAIGLILSIIVVSGAFTYSKLTQERETFTAFYMLNFEGKAENYPTHFSISDPIKIIIGIENYEHTDVNYILQTKLDGTILLEKKISLESKEIWEELLTVNHTQYKQGEQKLEFVLHKEKVSNSPYRSIYLWTTAEISTEENDIAASSATIDFIHIKNPSMKLDDGWEYVTITEDSVTGTYVNNSGIYSSQAFVINSTYEGNLGQWGTMQNSLQQDIYSNKTQAMLLSAFVKDNYAQGNPNVDEIQFKWVIINDEIVWTDGINGNEGWQHIMVPVIIQEGKNTLKFVLAQNRNLNLKAVELTIDEVSFIPLSSMSPYLREDNTIEFDLPVSKVLQLAQTVNDNKFIVSWNGTDDGSGIYYYDIDYSTDGANWKRWLSKTNTTSAEFEGEQGQTYYFKSKAVDNALNEEIKHTSADTSTTVDNTAPKIELDISPNPTSDTTYLTVESNKPLMEVECSVTPHNFGTTENIKFTSNNDFIWTASYKVKVQDNYNVEVFAQDHANNNAYTFGTIYTGDSLEELKISVDPKKAADDVDITIVSSIALEENPKVKVRDRYGNYLDVSFNGYSDNEYTYRAEIDDDIDDGTARIIVTANALNSHSLYEEETFIIDRIEPTIKSFSPGNGETVNTNNPSITASFSDNHAGVDKYATKLEVNGVDVTSNVEKDLSSIFYSTERLESGAIDVRLSVTDNAGNTAIESWTYYIST